MTQKETDFFASLFRCKLRFVHALSAASLVVMCLLFLQSASVEAKRISFNRDIRPIFSDKCYACHGPDANKRKANLRFDTKEGAFSAPGGYPVIVPGDLENSELVWRITNPDDSQRMPPPYSNRVLTPEQIELLKEWIAQGAEWEGHWVYIPPRRAPLPEVKRAEWPRNPIDYFILARLETEGLEPSPEADKRTLIRRLSFDLTGLPPTPAEVDAFLQDNSPQAYENLVNRLLSSPHYGERMALYWLDLVRYADTTGYHSDEPVSVWPYRDYVIRAFNDNMPFDRFARENLAGDLSPNATPEQKVASAYNRLNQTTAEGGAQAKEYLAMYAADRVRTTASVWLGATMGCAQCHDHKFDPYTLKDFYSFAAFFADIQEVGVYPGLSKREPILLLPTEEQKRALGEIEDKLGELQKEYEAPRPELEAEQARWEAETLQLLTSVEPADFAWIDDRQENGGGTEGEWNYVSKEQGPVFSQRFSRRQGLAPSTSSGQAPSGAEGAEEKVVQHLFRGAGRKMTLSEGDVLFAYVWIDPNHPPKTLMLQWNDGNWEHRAFWGEDKIDFGGIGADTPAHRPMGNLTPAGEWARLEVDPALVGLKPGGVLNGMAFTQFSGVAYWDAAGIRTTRASQTKHLHPETVLKAIQIDPVIRTEDQRKAIVAHYRAIAPMFENLRNQIADLKAKKAEIEEKAPFCLTTVSVQPRTIRMLPRGNWMDDSGAIVEPNTPEFLPPLRIEHRRATRLDLAEWIISPQNPLTARAFVNRLWHLFFGTGISKLLDDLGSQGEWPKHPELLDWLAVEFMESGWNVKHMVKLIVTSSVYRQSSKSTEELREKDPYNRLLARQSRWRLDAELVRDNALAISGLLASKIGGPSVKPYQPDGYYANLNFPKRMYEHDRGENQYRRGLYTHWQRTFPHPSLMAFDAPSRQECTAKRPSSNTPLQALTLLNDPSYVETARVFAERIVREGGRSINERVNWAFRWTLSRPPNAKEMEVVSGLYEKHRNEYSLDAAAAEKLVSTGERQAPKDLDLSELAAWTSVARVLLNLHEGMTRY
jgi:cytochrome c553